MSARPYSTSTAGRNYVLHIVSPEAGLTLCKRASASVNCTSDPVDRYGEEEICRTCLARHKKKPVRVLADAVAYVNEHHPLPRCDHGNALSDHGGERLEPRCCYPTPAESAAKGGA